MYNVDIHFVSLKPNLDKFDDDDTSLSQFSLILLVMLMIVVTVTQPVINFFTSVGCISLLLDRQEVHTAKNLANHIL